MNITLKHTAYILLLCCIRCFSTEHNDTVRLIPTTTKIGTFEYSQSTLSCGITNTSLTLFQSPGLRAYCCITSNVTDTSMLYVSMVLNSRFGSRFCNHHQGPIFLFPIYQSIVNTSNSYWSTGPFTSIITPIPSGLTRSIILSHTTCGPCITIACPSTLVNNCFALLNVMLTSIYSFTMTDSQCDALYTTCFNSVSNNIANMVNTSGVVMNNQEILFVTMLQSKWDCTHTSGGYNIGSPFGIPVGSYESFAINQFNNAIGSTLARKNAQLALSLLKIEKDITLYIASSDSSVLNAIPANLQYLSQKFSLTQCAALKQPVYGYAIPRGNSIINIRPSGTNSGSGATIFLGPCSTDSMIAAELITLLIKNNIASVIQNAYQSGTIFTSVFPMAGQMTLRLYSNSPLNGYNSWITLLNNLKARYSSITNINTDSADVNYQAAIANVYNKLTPQTTRIVTDTGLYNSALPSTCQGYVNWLILFQGSYSAFSDLQSLSNSTSTVKQQALVKAFSLIGQQSDPSIGSGLAYSVS